MQLHMHSLKSLVGKFFLSAVALSGFLVFAGAPAAQAQEWANSDPAVKAGRLSPEVHGPWLVDSSAIHGPAEPPGFEQYTLVLLKRGEHWNPGAPEFMDVMKQHHAYIKEITEQGSLAITGRSRSTIRASCGELPFSAWERSRL